MSQEPPNPPPGGPNPPPPASPPPPDQPPGYPPAGSPQEYAPGYPPPGYPPPGYPPYQQPARRGPSVWIIIAIVMGGCAALAVLVVVIGSAILFPTFSRARETARAAGCLSNGKQVAMGLMMYAQDYDEVLPPARRWETGVQPYVRNGSVFSCPSKPGSRHAFSYNAVLDRMSIYKVGSPNAEPLISESRVEQANHADRGESFDPRHLRSGGKAGVVAFVDGSVRLLPTLPDVREGLKEGVESPSEAR